MDFLSVKTNPESSAKGSIQVILLLPKKKNYFYFYHITEMTRQESTTNPGKRPSILILIKNLTLAWQL